MMMETLKEKLDALEKGYKHFVARDNVPHRLIRIL